MVLNDFRHDFKLLLAKEDLSTYKVAEMTGKLQPNISRMTNAKIISPMYEFVLDTIGYDIKVEYVKKKKK